MIVHRMLRFLALIVVELLLFHPTLAAEPDAGKAAYDRGDWSAAFEQLKPQADRGDPGAQARVGHMLIDGLGTRKNPELGLRMLQSALSADDPEAMLRMADLYFNGTLGLPKDPARGNALLDQAAARNHPEALSRIGTQTLFGIGRTKDAVKAAELLNRAADLGSGSAAELLGLAYLQGLGGIPPDHARATLWLRVAAERERPDAQALLGDRYWNGDGVGQDHVAANSWYQRATDHGNPIGMMRLGTNLVNGDGVDRDVSRGVDLLTRASAKGNDMAAERLGLMFWFGNLVDRDHARAIPLLKIAAKSRPNAQVTLGVADWNGDNTPVNHVEAVALFRKAAQAGNAEAQFHLSQALALGDGVMKDPVEAYAWATRAADGQQGPLKATYIQARDRLLAQMSPDEAARAKAQQPQSPMPYAPAGPVPNAPPPAAHKVSIGSGFIVNTAGTVLTDAHVVSDCKALRAVITDTNQTVEATILVKDPINDLAALKTGLTTIPPAPFRQDKPIRAGDGVVVIGYPLSTLLSREPNVTTGVVSAMAGLKGDRRYYQITAPVQKGNSGGPAADMSGNVIGIIQSKLDAMSIQQQFSDMPENVNFATKGDLVRKFLDDNAIAYGTHPAGESLSAADVADRIKQSMVLVECQQ